MCLLFFLEFRFFTCLPLRLLGPVSLLDWLQLSIIVTSMLCHSCSRLLDKSFSDYGVSRHLVGDLFCVLRLHLFVTCFGPLGRRLLTFGSWSLLFLRLFLVWFWQWSSLAVGLTSSCLCSGFLSCVALGLLVQLLPFGCLPALLVVCPLLFAASFCSLLSDVSSWSPRSSIAFAVAVLFECPSTLPPWLSFLICCPFPSCGSLWLHFRLVLLHFCNSVMHAFTHLSSGCSDFDFFVLLLWRYASCLLMLCVVVSRFGCRANLILTHIALSLASTLCC